MGIPVAQVLAVLALAANADVGAQTPHEGGQIIGSPHLQGNRLLGACKNPNGAYDFWAYQWKTKGFEVLASGVSSPKLCAGSTPQHVVWFDSAGSSWDNIRFSYFTLEEETRQPVRLGIGPAADAGKPGQGIEPGRVVEGTDYYIGIDFSSDELVLWDIVKNEERSRKAYDYRAIFTFSPAAGESRDLILIGSHLSFGPNRGSRITLCTLPELTELASIHMPDLLARFVCTDDLEEVLLEMDVYTPPEFRVLRLTPSTDKTADRFTVRTLGAIPPKAKRRLHGTPGAEFDISTASWRHGRMFWATEKPSQVVVLEEGQHYPDDSVSIPFTSDQFWDFRVNATGTIVFTPYGSDALRIWMVDKQDEALTATLIDHCRLTYAADSNELKLVHCPITEEASG